MKITCTFGQLRKDDIPIAGGKGANLGELTSIGVPVPFGFVITTAAYEKFVAENRLQDAIMLELLKRKDGETIRELFLQEQIPNETEQAIIQAYQELGAKSVAVRSSATAEDLPGAAFAGQQDTYLNIKRETLIDAVKKVWASLWTERAIAYRERLGVDQATVKIAVVVQQMINAEVAGVLFTANTITGARDEIVINASPGLGEAVVSGEVTPDHFVLRKHLLGWRITERRIGLRETVIRARKEGGTEHVATDTFHDVTLEDQALRQLAQLGNAIERHFGVPQDIEWAWAESKPFILQARPITALPLPQLRTSTLARFIASNFAEIFAFRPYPLDLDTWIPALAGAIEPLFETLGFKWSLDDAFEQEDGVAVKFKVNFPRPTWKTLLAPLLLISLARRYDPLRWQSDPRISEAQARARNLESRNLQTISWNELLQSLHDAGEITFIAAGDVRRRYFPGALLAAIRLRILLMFLGRRDQFSALLSGVRNKTLEANAELEALADIVRSDRNLGVMFLQHEPAELWRTLNERTEGKSYLTRLNTFLDRYGHRESVLGSAHEPTWKDAPEIVLGMIKSFVAHSPERKLETPAWQETRDELLMHPWLQLSFVRSSFIHALEKARLTLQIREDTHFYATLSLPIIRRILLECGRRLVHTGILDVPEDVFHLTLSELKGIDDNIAPSSAAATSLRATAIRRQKKRVELGKKPLVDPRLFSSNVRTNNALLSGMPGSPGIAEGPARIVRNSLEFKRLTKGDVLVAPFTNPAWTPLFERAVAVVVDSGSVASHAAIVAREYGIPAVMGTIEGTTKLKDDMRIRVDGTQGAVFVVNP
jgi:rifampicin phosphotransferase